ncbi:hypothetical protein WJX81_000743 [Elliptochloris bilobata]|uniref:Lactoylglutathione lyase n=1 Tax=Elliptochloris bilobata TaxID=381761 RepID=A0AAW1S592_9CHLO
MFAIRSRLCLVVFCRPSTLQTRRGLALCTSTHTRQTIRTTTAMSQSKDELFATPRDPATIGFSFQQTMFRIKDQERSLDFYTRVMGMTLLSKLDFEPMKFSLLFLGMAPPESVPEDPGDRVEWMFGREGVLELTHNWGSEDDPGFKTHSGNEDPKGFGHIGFAVPDVEAACKRFEELGVEFVKRPNDGKMKGIAFIKDPDGYWIEILNPKASRDFVGWRG